jgi:hypothetical protein
MFGYGALHKWGVGYKKLLDSWREKNGIYKPGTIMTF